MAFSLTCWCLVAVFSDVMCRGAHAEQEKALNFPHFITNLNAIALQYNYLSSLCVAYWQELQIVRCI
jgi:hypothetical protein